MKELSAVSILLCVLAFALLPSCKHNPYIPDNILYPDSSSLAQPCDPNTVYFINQVQPIIVSNCAKSGCHDAATAEHGYDLSTFGSIVESGAVRPRRPDDSKLWELINTNDPGDIMPPAGNTPLTPDQKDMIRLWIVQGAQNNGCMPSTCDTANVSLNAVVQPVLSTYCYGCHSASSAANSGAGINLETYSTLKNWADNGKLVCVINHANGCIPMPQGGAKLPQCEIDQIQAWVNDGALNN